ncbi:hypothetical protein HDU97_006383 [Phlyctochytrium planicorne]|nr:hypothetical protein HDU97_006383 [Phlyctochytrium planicorne]
MANVSESEDDVDDVLDGDDDDDDDENGMFWERTTKRLMGINDNSDITTKTVRFDDELEYEERDPKERGEASNRLLKLIVKDLEIEKKDDISSKQTFNHPQLSHVLRPSSPTEQAQQSLQQLASEERKLLQEIALHERQILNYDKSKSKESLLAESSSIPGSKAANESSSTLNSAQDSDIQRYHANNEAFLPACATSILGISLAEAKMHEEWYRKYQALLELKKKALSMWKKRKEIQRKNSELSEIPTEKDRDDKKGQKEREEREKMKEQIFKWREEQRVKREEAEQLANMMREKQKMDQLKKDEDRIVQYIREKNDQEALQRLIEIEDERVKKKLQADIAAKEIKRFKSRDDEIVFKKLNNQKEAERKELEKEQRLLKIKSKVAISVERDPSRVLKATEGYQHRLASPRQPPEEAVQALFSANRIPKR